MVNNNSVNTFGRSPSHSGVCMKIVEEWLLCLSKLCKTASYTAVSAACGRCGHNLTLLHDYYQNIPKLILKDLMTWNFLRLLLTRAFFRIWRLEISSCSPGPFSSWTSVGIKGAFMCWQSYSMWQHRYYTWLRVISMVAVTINIMVVVSIKQNIFYYFSAFIT